MDVTDARGVPAPREPAGPYHPADTDVPRAVPSTAELKTKYLALQQEADFALWRAREANAETRLAYQLALDGQGQPPSVERLAEVHQLEQQAETKYRELRSFLREHFEQLAVA